MNAFELRKAEVAEEQLEFEVMEQIYIIVEREYHRYYCTKCGDKYIDLVEPDDYRGATGAPSDILYFKAQCFKKILNSIVRMI